MKISIITTCYNREKTIQDAIESVLSQDYPSIEYIVVDGASTDNSLNIIQQYASRIAVIISEPDRSMYEAINKGIRMATGDVIGLLHSDDLFFSENTLSEIAETFQTTHADLVYANGQYVDMQNISHVKRIYPAGNFKKSYLKFGWIPLHTTIYVRREVFEKYGLYDESYQIAGDYEISLRWFLNDEIKKIFLDKWVVKMRLGGKSTSMSLQKRKSAEDLQIIKKYRLYGKLTLFCKIAQKFPQYLLPKILHF